MLKRLEFLVRYAILAPSSHNTEPWQFRVQENRIDVLLDFPRWLKVADDDQRELHISVGCALENLLVAAEHFGRGHDIVLLPHADDPSLAATVTFREEGQPMSQIVQAPELKAEVAALIPESGLVPQHPFRKDYAPAEKHHTPRRPVNEVLV